MSRSEPVQVRSGYAPSHWDGPEPVDLEIHYEDLGNVDDPPVLLIMGLGAQLVLWHDEFCQKLVDLGYRVIRFDNRDVGLTTRIDAAGPADMPAIITALMEGRAPPVAYTLSDMAADAVGLLDAHADPGHALAAAGQPQDRACLAAEDGIARDLRQRARPQPSRLDRHRVEGQT